MRLFALASICSIFIPSFQQLCSGRCGSYININVTVPEPVIIPCGDLQLSNTSTADYCNATDGISKLLVEAATTPYNLTVTEISHFNNIIYCTDNLNKIFCYRLTVFFAPFVPSDFVPNSVDIMDAGIIISLMCPFINAGNPPPVCTWRRFDSENISHQLTVNSLFFDQSNCSFKITFHEDDNGLYQCTGLNEVGNNTYTFPKRFIVEKCAALTLIIPSLFINQPPLFNANENVTLLCSASAVTKHASLIWMIDGVMYNSTGVFSSTRGLVMVEQSVFDVSVCMMLSSLTILNVRSNSQGVYSCVVQDNSFVLSKNVSLMLQSQMNDSTEKTSLAPIVGGTLAGIVGFLLILITLLAIAALYYRRNQHTYHPTDTSMIINTY